MATEEEDDKLLKDIKEAHKPEQLSLEKAIEIGKKVGREKLPKSKA